MLAMQAEEYDLNQRITILLQQMSEALEYKMSVLAKASPRWQYFSWPGLYEQLYLKLFKQ